jgi:hypothetical protein
MVVSNEYRDWGHGALCRKGAMRAGSTVVGEYASVVLVKTVAETHKFWKSLLQGSYPGFTDVVTRKA